MNYDDLEVYPGPLTACKQCERPFKRGEVFTLADDGNLAFCYSDGDGGCLTDYLFFTMEPKRALFGEPRVFVEYSADEPISAPDPPPTLWQRIAGFFGHS